MEGPQASRSWHAGWIIVFGTAVAFMIVAVITVLTPLRGEEELAGLTFAELQAENPGLAAALWHVNAGIGVIVFGVSFLVAVLAWRGLARGSRSAWFSVLIVGVTFAVAIVVVHGAIGHPSFAHWGPPLLLTVAMLIGLGLAAKPVFSASV